MQKFVTKKPFQLLNLPIVQDILYYLDRDSVTVSITQSSHVVQGYIYYQDSLSESVFTMAFHNKRAMVMAPSTIGGPWSWPLPQKGGNGHGATHSGGR